MRKWFYKSLATLLRRNLKSTPPEVILDQLNEPRPLPLGKKEFHEWADRIISGALVSATEESQKFALANMLLHLGPTESHKCDAHFIHSLRKFAINEVADDVRKELREAKLKREEQEKAANEVLANESVSEVAK